MTRTRWAGPVWGGLVGLMVLLLPATAAVAVKEGPCDGTVLIDEVLYTPANDSPSNPIVIPDEEGLVAFWNGFTDSPITNHQGSVGIVLGPGSVTVASWEGENADEETSAEGEYEIDEAREELPFAIVGLYEVEASHSGDGGACTGQVMVLIEGNPLATPIGIGSVVGTVLAGVGLVAAGRGRGGL